MSQSTVHDPPTVSVRSLVEYPLPRGQLVLGVRGEPPAWIQPTLKTLGHLLRLPQDWDSYGGRPVDPGCVWAAWQLLLALIHPAPASQRVLLGTRPTRARRRLMFHRE